MWKEMMEIKEILEKEGLHCGLGTNREEVYVWVLGELTPRVLRKLMEKMEKFEFEIGWGAAGAIIIAPARSS